MSGKISLALKAGLLHDVGKVCIRATHERQRHSILGAEFIRSFLADTEADKQLLRCIKYHHGRELSGAGLDIDDLAYVIYEADNIAAGADRREAEGDLNDRGAKFDSDLCLENIFNVFSGDAEPSYFSLRELDAMKKENFPHGNKSIATQGQYASIMRYMEKNFRMKSPISMEENELLRILEDTLIYVPSSTNTEEHADISLYDHMKMTGATAAVLMKYMKTLGITDYKGFCFTHNKENRNKDVFLMISGDFSGIQKFIYHIRSEGAMRMLRGRSFYLDIALENIVDELLNALHLSRANLIYCSGGHFYILADNTKETQGAVKDVAKKINQGLVKLFSGTLYLAIGCEPLCANDLMAESDTVHHKKNIFRSVSEKVSMAKLSRYGPDILTELFDENSNVNRVDQGARECGICHISTDQLSSYKGNRPNAGTDIQACEVCNGLYDLGKALIDDKRSVFAVLSEKAEGSDRAMPISACSGLCWLTAASPDDLKQWAEAGILKRIYDKNGSYTSSFMASRLWVADYAAKNEIGKVLDFNELAESSGDKTGKGIKRLGVLRADVDGLGAAFIAGFIHKENKNPEAYATLSRYAALSRSMALFFRKIIKGICKKELPEGIKPFYLFEDKDGEPRKIHVVYSGGDDLFLVGAWDDLMGFAVDLKRVFSVYTNGKLTFSAGLGLYSSTYPISRMAEVTGELEELAKNSPGKNSIALFGSGTEYHRNEKNGGAAEKENAAVYTWDEFIEKVHGEKIKFLMEHMLLDGINGNNKRNDRISTGKSLLYKLMNLLQGAAGDRMDLARFAYTLARLKPKEKELQPCYEKVRSRFYQWAVKEEERKELVTALQFIIYRMRDKEEA